MALLAMLVACGEEGSSRGLQQAWERAAAAMCDCVPADSARIQCQTAFARSVGLGSPGVCEAGVLQRFNVTNPEQYACYVAALEADASCYEARACDFSAGGALACGVVNPSGGCGPLPADVVTDLGVCARVANCADGTTLELDSICDGIPHCVDGSDEQDC